MAREYIETMNNAPISRDTRLLMATRAVRSIGQGVLVVDFALYLSALGWSAASIGAVFGAGLAFGVFLTMLSGPASDRFGRKRFLLAYEAMYAAAALIALGTSGPIWLSIAAIIGGFGHGANGAAGPFTPVEQAWLAQGIAPRQRGRVYSFNAGIGFFGMGLGAVIAGAPTWLGRWFPDVFAYRMLFAVVLVGSLVCIALIARCRDIERTKDASAIVENRADQDRHENRLLGKLALVNLLNGASIGLVGPFMAYWFTLRFGQTPALVGLMMAIGFTISGLGAFGAGRLTLRLGIVRSVVTMRLAGLIILFLLPFAPSFWIGACLYVLRAACNRATQGARQALTISLVRSGRRGAAATIGNVSIQIPRAIMPLLAGFLLDAGFLVLPFVIAAGFQSAYLVLYRRVFLPHDPIVALKTRLSAALEEGD